MNCLILNGNPRPSGFDAWIEGFAKDMEGAGAGASIMMLRELRIACCTGCWSCWLADPGRCAIQDDMEAVLRAAIRADLIVYASPLVLGAPSALVKKVQDRMIPMVHPYIEIVGGECHHRRRYPRSADLGLVLEPGPQDGPRDLEIVRRMHERLARNMRSRLRLCVTTDKGTEEAAREAIGA
jgi:hypothetical protein